MTQKVYPPAPAGPNASQFYRIGADGAVESKVFAATEKPDAGWFDSPKKAAALAKKTAKKDEPGAIDDKPANKPAKE